MHLRELRWRYSADAAVRSDFVVIFAPERDGAARLVKVLKPSLVWAVNSGDELMTARPRFWRNPLFAV